MDLKQALQQRGGGNASKSSANSSVQSDGGNNSSCSNNNSTSTNTGESKRGSSPAAAAHPLLSSYGGGGSSSSLLNYRNSNSTSGIPPASHLTSAADRTRSSSELDAVHDPRLLKLARLHHDPPSPHSTTLETQVLFNLNGTFNSNTNNSNTAANHHGLSSYLSSSNHSSNHGSPTSNNYAAASTSTCSLFNGGSPNSSKLYPFASLQEDPNSRQQSPFILSAVPASQGSLLSSASMRAHHTTLSCFNPEPVVSLFTPEQLLEFTQQTYVFKHFVAGVTPPPTLLVPIINSVASMGRIGMGSMHYGGNAGLFGVGGLRGNIDPEPGRCRRTDGKKWRCAREVVADQKYCERHMHRGRHRARANKLANGGTDTLSTSTSLPSNAVTNTSNLHSSSGISASVTAPFVSSAPKEPHLHFSLQPASAVSTQLNRSSSNASDGDQKPALLPSSSSASGAGGLKRLLEASNIGGPLSRSLAAQPETPPNLAELLKAIPTTTKTNLTNHLPKAGQHTTMGLDAPFPFACHTSDRDADHSELRQFVGDGDQWPRISRVTDNPPSGLSWFEQLSEEQNKRSRFNTELSISTHKSPLTNLSTKFGGSHQEDLVGGVDASHFMGLSMDVGAKVDGLAKLEEDRYNGRTSWVPIAWESPALGGPLGEVLQSNAANNGGSFGGSLANSGGERCLNLIEEESWVHQEGGHVSSPAKDGHSPSLASPTGVLQMKASFASYSDSSSSASSPRSALKLESANLGM
ncbi:hypothetical protein GOP47_0003881 [Adiantum capillus-veneris]|uniref:Growth-regulating factor n=1 Tax=Adiantum capillus-veneris TaxID=13818 RepID=A0A9D4V6T8_ADICA|nr:hypothetical protein GOP47_0003881 [Adiantum capillus-veneris]